MNLLAAEYYGPPGGIYQGDPSNAPPGAIIDGRNLDSSGDVLKVRPALRCVAEFDYSFTPLGMFEYIPDERFTFPQTKTILYSANSGVITNHDVHIIYEINSQSKISGVSYPRELRNDVWLSHCKAMYRSCNGDAINYYPCVLLSDGENIHVYRQYPEHRVDYLDAQDGNDSDISYLKEVPRAKIVISYKNRIFALNCKEAGNRLYWTTVDANRVWTANVWPASYNLDLGSGASEIVGAAVFNDALVILKRDSIWAISGDGIGGIWDVQNVCEECDCIGHHTIVNLGDSLVWAGRHGIYRWNGGRPQRVSHPAIQNFWGEKINLSTERSIAPAAHDEKNKRILFPVFNPAGIIVFNYERGTWDLWGFSEIPEYCDQHTVEDTSYKLFPLVCCYSKEVIRDSIVAAAVNPNAALENSYSLLHVMIPNMGFDVVDCDVVSPAQESDYRKKILWWARTREFYEDSTTKLLRHVIVELSTESSEEIKFIVLGKDADMYLEHLRDKGQRWGVLGYDSHTILYYYNVYPNGTVFLGEDYDVYLTKTWKKVCTKTNVDAYSSSRVAFTTEIDDYVPGEYSITQKNKSSIIKKQIDPDGDLLDGNTKLIGFNIAARRRTRYIIPCNKIDRQFSVLITNSPEVDSTDYSSTVHIYGWGILAKPRELYRR